MTTGRTTYPSFVTYSCNTGYTRSGDQTRTCQANGDWSGSEPVCNRECIHECMYTLSITITINHDLFFLAVDCGPLTIHNGQVSTSSGTTFRSTATYSCNPSYTQNGPSTRTCQANTMWSGAAPTCNGEIIKDCIERNFRWCHDYFSELPNRILNIRTALLRRIIARF